MLKLHFTLLLILSGLLAKAQTAPLTLRTQLPQIVLGDDLTVHLVSPEPIQYVDLSSHRVIGDLPLKTVLRIRLVPDSMDIPESTVSDLGILTVVGERYMAQYNLRYLDEPGRQFVPSRINIHPDQGQALDLTEVGLSEQEMKNAARQLLSDQHSIHHSVRNAKAFGMKLQLNGVYTLDDFIFLDLGLENQTNLNYTLDEMRLSIDDKKVRKATNVQSLEIRPRWQLIPPDRFPIQGRTVLVLDKLTFPDNKVLTIRLTEKQHSGRTITLKVKYSDILKAKKLNGKIESE